MRRMEGFTRIALAAMAVLCLASVESARADKPKFRQVAEFDAKGGAKEVAAVQEAHYCRIDVVAGRVIINTIVIREGQNKTPITVAADLSQGAQHVIDFGMRRNITGLRISDGGGGRYKVFLKR